MTFAASLRQAMLEKGMNATELAAASGVNRQTISESRKGPQLPAVATVELLADALDRPLLVAQIVALRTRTCELCEADFVWGSGRTKRYCGRRCQSAAHARLGRERDRKHTLTETRMTRKRLDDIRAAVAEMCRKCTLGESSCWDATCPLRPVSPLPLSSEARRAA